MAEQVLIQAGGRVRLWLLSLKVTQLLRSVASLHTNQSWSYLKHLVKSEKKGLQLVIGNIVISSYQSLNYNILLCIAEDCECNGFLYHQVNYEMSLHCHIENGIVSN
jgi:hypothetical protein